MKRLVLCCDGTWNRPDEEEDGRPVPTNVVKLAYRVAKRDPQGITQVIFYDLGVGTGNVIDRFTGGVLGKGLEDNILDAYRFLIGNYEPGDAIFLFGFSRGAFTARSIAGMIRKCGILKRSAIDKYREATALYRSDEGPDSPKAVAFRQQYSVSPDAPIDIQFIGVWDTVGSLGIPKSGGVTQAYQFHDTELSGSVRNACHALAIDEHRQPFLPTLWDYKPKPGQQVEQVWFSGAHSDVGGGYPQDQTSLICLQWMLDKAAAAGLALDSAAMQAYPIQASASGKIHDSKGWLYALQKSVNRAMGVSKHNQQPDPTQSVHPSVLARWDQDPGYRPENLRNYLRSIQDPRATMP